MIGSTLSHYRIVAELGRGGMGIVYKAEDTKLDRTVALKILPASALTSEDDRARFYREAKAAAQLNHPHIAAIHEIDEAVPEGGSSEEPRPFIAMEYIDGVSLEDKAKEAPMSLEETVRLASQIALALEAAHEKNIVHRDIKSANVMLTEKGVAKVLDFGLAKTAHSTMLTRMGSTLGTAAYMSPEQARGLDVDHRTDLWALGVVLYELVAGRLPFGGDYEQAVTYSILNEDPQPLTAIRTGVPMGLEWIVSKLLAKNTDERYQSAKDLVVDLKTVDLSQAGMSRNTSVASMPVAPAAAKSSTFELTKRLHPAVLIAIAAVILVSGYFLGAGSSDARTDATMKRVTQAVPLGALIGALDISDDGNRVAFASSTIQVLNLTQGTMRTYDAPGVYVHLAFSPDGERLLLTTSTGISILSLDSGSVVDVMTTTEGGPRAEWVDQETIVFEDVTSVYERSLTSGEVRAVVVLDSLEGQYDLDFPMMLPDGKTMVATAQYRGEGDRIGFWDLESGENKGVIDLPGLRPQWIDSGHLVFVMNGDIMAMPFDLNELKQAGPLISLDQNVRPEGFSLSQEGTLAHVGAQVGVVNNSLPIVPMILRQVEATMMTVSPFEEHPSAIYRSGRVNPDGTKAAVVVESEVGDLGVAASNIWILDFETGTRRAITADGFSDYPAWSVTGDSLYYINTEGNDALMVRAATGRGGETLLLETAIPGLVDLTISPDGKTALMAGGLSTTMDAASEILFWDLDNSASTLPGDWDKVLQTPNGNPRHFDFSPDGKYFAYEDQGAIFVQSIEDFDSTPYNVWDNGKSLPRWAHDGSQLYVRDDVSGGDGIEVQLDPVFSTIGAPTDYSQYWYVMQGDLFDTFPEKDVFLTGYPDPSIDPGIASDSTVADIDLRLIVNLTNELSRSNN